MKAKTATVILKDKVSMDITDSLFEFNRDLPFGMQERFTTLINTLVPAIYYADRVEESEWVSAAMDEPVALEPLLLIYEVGASPVTGYFDGDFYRDIQTHRQLRYPMLYRHIQLPLK